MRNGYLTGLIWMAVGGLVIGVVLVGTNIPLLAVISGALLALGVLSLIAFMSVNALIGGLRRDD